MAKLKITEFELVDHGIDSPSYFQGCGTTFTSYDHVVTGTGDNPREALDDLIEQAAQYGIRVDHEPMYVERDGEKYVNNAAWDSVDVSDLHARIIESEGDNAALVTNEDGTKDFPEEPSAWAKMLEANGLDDFDDEEEPDRDDFESDEDYEEAQAEYDRKSEEYNDLNDCGESNNYYLSLRFNVGPKEGDTE